MSRLALAALAALLTLSACDAVGDDAVSVRGRVVDDVTGAPLDPGPAVVTVDGSSFLDSRTLVHEPAGADGRFDLSASARGTTPSGLEIASNGRIEYPGADTSAVASAFGLDRLAYFPFRGGFRQNAGTVRLLPTCLTLGDVNLSRPLTDSEYVDIRLAPVPAVPATTGLTNTEARIANDLDVPETLRLYAVGGRTVRFDWTLGQYNPPTGTGQTGIARGSIELPACPRHDVLRYAAEIGLP